MLTISTTWKVYETPNDIFEFDEFDPGNFKTREEVLGYKCRAFCCKCCSITARNTAGIPLHRLDRYKKPKKRKNYLLKKFNFNRQIKKGFYVSLFHFHHKEKDKAYEG